MRTGLRQITCAAALTLAFAILSLSKIHASASAARPFVLLVVGAPGEDAYEAIFTKNEHLWREAATKGGAEVVTIGLDKIDGPESDADRRKFKETLDTFRQPNSSPAWIVLIGHGTDNGKEAKFNLRGPDFSAAELADWLKPAQRPLIIINTASSSGGFIKALSATNRIVITATRSGGELNYARFGEYIAQTIGSLDADLDKDEQTSLLEAFLMASRRVADFYKDEGRLATEHALLDDNGDGLGTPADFFSGVRAVKKPDKGQSVDGRRAHQVTLIPNASDQKLTPEQRARRDELELQLGALRDRKSKTPAADYQRELEKILFDIARVYEASEQNASASAVPK